MKHKNNKFIDNNNKRNLKTAHKTEKSKCYAFGINNCKFIFNF